jgi:hypothetical protein
MKCTCSEIEKGYEELKEEIYQSIELSIEEKIDLAEDYDRYCSSDQNDCINRNH